MDLKGKSVIVVGPAGYLENEDNTDYINSFDIVCRPNVRIKNKKLSFPPNTGDRCDIIFHSGGWMGQSYDIGNGRTSVYTENDGICENLLRTYKLNGIKRILICSDWNLRIINAMRICDSIGMPWSIVSVPNNRFTTGFHGLCEIAINNPSRLAIKGFDFYQTNNRGYEGYYDGHRGDSDGHNHKESFEFFIYSFLPKFKIEIDNHLKKLIFQYCGYFIMRDVFTPEFINDCVREINPVGVRNKNIVNFTNYPKTFSLKDNQNIHDNLKVLLGTSNYRFCSHNDIGINRVTGWHKDVLNNQYKVYETISPFVEHENQKHNIVKVCIYLQDHSHDDNALKVIPQSHLHEDLFKYKNSIQLRPCIGDVIIFDQRITHCGAHSHVNEPRILVSFGFGENNIFTDNFEMGTIKRQNDQYKE
jgi:hypothetical protein